MRSRSGFTLIELIVVISVVLTLAGMLTPIIQIATRAAKRTNTQALLSKVDAGLRRFKLDMGVYPYQSHDTSSGSFASLDNRLAYHLTHTLTSSELTALNQDANTAAAAYDAGIHRFTTASTNVSNQHDTIKAPLALVLNRMARERAGLMIQAGHTSVKGVAANTGFPLLPSGGTTKGWASDYLAGDIPKRNIQGDSIVDFYGHPLLYNAPVICGIHGPCVCPTHLTGYENTYYYVKEDLFGLNAIGRTSTTSMNSDQALTAAIPYTLEFEVWSAGADGRIDPLRNHQHNADNLSAGPYLKSLLP